MPTEARERFAQSRLTKGEVLEILTERDEALERLAEVEAERDEAIDDVVKEGAEVLELREAAGPVLRWADTLSSWVEAGAGQTVPERCAQDLARLRRLLAGEGAEDE